MLYGIRTILFHNVITCASIIYKKYGKFSAWTNLTENFVQQHFRNRKCYGKQQRSRSASRWCGSGSDFSLWCGSGSSFLTRCGVQFLMKVRQICAHVYKLSTAPFGASARPLRASSAPPRFHFSLQNIDLDAYPEPDFKLMLVRIRIQLSFCADPASQNEMDLCRSGSHHCQKVFFTI
jgi:hypothetical protein